MDASERRLAVLAEGAYLINLLALPLIGTLYCVATALKYMKGASPALRSHLLFTAWGSLLAPALLSGMTYFYYLQLGLTPHFWFATLSFLAIFHTSFVIIGLYTLAKALAAKGL
ncbi:MAG: hypothetical protein D6758_03070 [Gammaproteobacteria bacterium]|nr:MAG: hypothetical protein D6758_03070 [Gammaproteobacteria bacterium]